MGYSTDFFGVFKLNKKLDNETFEFLKKLNETRRMKRLLGKEYGIDGELYVDGDGFKGQDRDLTIVDYNTPPRSQPSLWCQWTPTSDAKGIQWDGNEKFYEYVPWIEYIIEKILAPRGYKLSGEVEFQGEERDDRGKIVIKNNKVTVKTARVTFR